MNGRSLAHLICWLRPAGVALALCGAGDVSTQVAAQDAELTDRTYDQRLLDGLRERGLFRLAAAHCRAELARSDLDERRRVELVIELSQTLADEALASAEGDRYWQEAIDATAQFAAAAPDSAWLPLVRVQAALVRLARAESSRQQAELRGASPRGLDDVREQLRDAATALRSEADAVNAALAAGDVPLRRDGDQPSRDEWLVLRTNIAYQLSRALKGLAQTYPDNSPDRFNSLNGAAELLGPLAQLPVEHPRGWPSRVDLVACLRLLGDPDAARRKLELFATQNPPAASALRLEAERIRLLLMEQRLDEALALAEATPATDAARSGELDLARLETYLSAWRAAAAESDETAAEAFKKKSQQTLTEIETYHGSYWARRGGLLLAAYLAAAPATGDLAVLVRAAESLYRSGQLDDALAAYDRARGRAAEDRQSAHQFQLAFAAAAIEQERGRHGAAADRYRELALAQPAEPRSAEAHYLAIQNLAAAIRDAADTATKEETERRLAERIAWLDEHLERWPESDTADDCRWLLSRHQARRRAWGKSLEMIAGIDPGYPDYDQVLSAAGEAFAAWIAERSAAGEPTDSLEAQADAFFRRYLPETNVDPVAWDPVSRAAAVAVARLRLAADVGSMRGVEAMLTSATAGLAPEAPSHDAAYALLALAQARQGHVRDALASLRAVRDESTAPLLELLSELERTDAAPESAHLALAELRLQTAERLSARADELDDSERLRVELAQARALADAAMTDPAKLRKALAAYASLATRYPQDATVHREQAEIYVRLGDPTSLASALKKWRYVERKSPAGSDDWFRAKYYLALVHGRLGNVERGRDIVALTRALHPDLGGAEWQRRFDDLLASELR